LNKVLEIILTMHIHTTYYFRFFESGKNSYWDSKNALVQT